ncbi:MAG: hypothetical protein ACK57C_09970 [Bacteroidota bacterium]
MSSCLSLFYVADAGVGKASMGVKFERVKYLSSKPRSLLTRKR